MHHSFPQVDSIRVLYVSAASDLGGAEQSLCELLLALHPDRFASQVVLPKRGRLSARLEEHFEVQYCRHLAWKNFREQPTAMPCNAYRTIMASRHLARLVSRGGVDVIYANGRKPAFPAVLAARRLGIPVVWHLREHTRACELRSLASMGAIPLASSPSGVLHAHRILGTAPHFIQMGIDATKLPLPSLVIESEGGRESSPRPLVIVAIAHQSGWKGYDILLRAFSMARLAFHGLRLVIVGRVRTDTIEKMDQQDSGVEFVGEVDNVVPYMQCADFMVHAAYPEPFGRVIVEALAMGLPVVAFGGPHGPADTITRAGGGVLVRPRTAAALSAAILRVATDVAIHRKGAYDASLVVRREYTAVRVAQELSQFFEYLVATGRRI